VPNSGNGGVGPRGHRGRFANLPRPPELGSQFCPWPTLGSVAFACTIGKSGRTRKTHEHYQGVGAVMLTETHGALHGAQISEIPGSRMSPARARALPTADYTSPSVVIELSFDTLEYVHPGPAPLQRPSRHRDAVRDFSTAPTPRTWGLCLQGMSGAPAQSDG
jgi:hypothetical protein